MQFKPTKGKVLVSLIPVYFLIPLIPLVPSLFGFYGYSNKINSIGLFFEGLAWFFYGIFIVLGFPFRWLLSFLNLIEDVHDVLPEINPFGLILLAIIYSSLLYLLISFFQKNRKLGEDL